MVFCGILVIAFLFQGDAVLAESSEAKEYLPLDKRGIPLLALFVPMQVILFAGMIDWHNLWKRIHLDFISINLGLFAAFFLWAKGEFIVSVIILVITFAYTLTVLVRRILDKDPQTLRPSLPTWFFVSAIIIFLPLYALFGFIFPVSDVGESGITGASLLRSGEAVYGNFPDVPDQMGSSYGPLTYLFYVPFDFLSPWANEGLPNFMGARYGNLLLLFLILGTVFLIGKKFYNTRGALLATFAFLSFPGNLVPVGFVSNDLLFAWTLLLTLLFAGKPAARGVLTGISVMTKWFSIPLAPLFSKIDAKGVRTLQKAEWIKSPRELFTNNKTIFWPLFALTAGLWLLLGQSISLDRGSFLDNTFGAQFAVESPFVLWSYLPEAKVFLQPVLILLALSSALVPLFMRQKISVGLAAAGATITLILLQMSLNDWFYTFVIWFYPLLVFALLKEPQWGRSEKEPQRQSGER